MSWQIRLISYDTGSATKEEKKNTIVSPALYSLSEENFVQLLWTTCWILNNRIARCQDQSFKQYVTVSSSRERFTLSAGWIALGLQLQL